MLLIVILIKLVENQSDYYMRNINCTITKKKNSFYVGIISSPDLNYEIHDGIIYSSGCIQNVQYEVDCHLAAD